MRKLLILIVLLCGCSKSYTELLTEKEVLMEERAFLVESLAEIPEHSTPENTKICLFGTGYTEEAPARARVKELDRRIEKIVDQLRK